MRASPFEEPVVSGDSQTVAAVTGAPRARKRARRRLGLQSAWCAATRKCPKTARRLDQVAHERIFCYVLRSLVWNGPGSTYVGYTVDSVTRRLRKHNGVIKGGAGETVRRRPWSLLCYVEGFCSQTDARRFEWRMQHPSRWHEGRAAWRAALAACRATPLELHHRWHFVRAMMHTEFVSVKLGGCGCALKLVVPKES